MFFDLKKLEMGANESKQQQQELEKASDNSHTQLLFEACKKGDLEMAKCLLELPQRPSALHEKEGEGGRGDFICIDAKVGQFGRTCLHFAAANGHKEIVTLLISKGAEVDAMDSDDWRPLHGAVRNGHADVLEILISRGSKVDRPACNLADKNNTQLMAVLHGQADSSFFFDIPGKIPSKQERDAAEQARKDSEKSEAEKEKEKMQREIEELKSQVKQHQTRQESSGSIGSKNDETPNQGSGLFAPVCCLCNKEPATLLMVPCGHQCLCSGDCKTQLEEVGRQQCPLCNTNYTQMVEVKSQR